MRKDASFELGEGPEKLAGGSNFLCNFPLLQVYL
jgi:hypothetical protein